MGNPPEGTRLVVVALVVAMSMAISGIVRATGDGPERPSAEAGLVAAADLEEPPALGPGARREPEPAPTTTTTTGTTTRVPPSTATTAPLTTTTTSPPVPTTITTAAPAVTVTSPPAAAAPRPAATRLNRLPVGKGMWLYQLSQAGDPEAVVRRARDAGLTHLYLRVGSSKMGFYGGPELNALLPVAHAAGLKVVGWDFVYLFDPAVDAERSMAAINYTTPEGHRMDAFSADIETAAEGVNLTAEGAAAYGARLRELAGPGYPLIATVPRPSPKRWFPFAEATAHFDAIAPMVYWMNRDPAADARAALADLAPLGKPVMPIGQAYDGAPEGGPAGDPSGEDITAFLGASMDHGAVAVSFWVWHHATGEQWEAIEEARAWELAHSRDRAQNAYLQRILGLFGHRLVADGILGPQTAAALAATQSALGLPATGVLDRATARALLWLSPSG